MNTIKTYSLIIITILTNITVYAQQNFGMALNVHQIEKCEEFYTRSCTTTKKISDVGTKIMQEQPCIKSKMHSDQSCHQAYLIRQFTNYPPTKIQQYPQNISVFYITAIADGQTVFYIVDSTGNLIELTDELTLVKSDPAYIRLKRKYPNLSFTTFLFWSRQEKNQFPKLYSSKSSIQLVFKQELRDGPCVACKNIAIAYIVYKFTSSGHFIGTKLLRIHVL